MITLNMIFPSKDVVCVFVLVDTEDTPCVSRVKVPAEKTHVHKVSFKWLCPLSNQNKL